MTITSTTVGKNCLKEMGKPHSQQKNSKCSTWVQSQKWWNDHCFQGKPFNITIIQVYAATTKAEEAEVEWFCDDLQDLLELTPKKKDVLLIIGNRNGKVGSQEKERK